MGSVKNTVLGMRLRLEYRKLGSFRFISHLDWLNALKRALRRASIPIGYSGGFSPQMKISLGPPLPVGVEGLREYVDLELTEVRVPLDVVHKLNEELPPELWFLRCESSPDFDIVKFVNFSIYDVFLSSECELKLDGVKGALYKIIKLYPKVYRLFLFLTPGASGIVKLLFSSGLSWQDIFLIRRLGIWRFEDGKILNPFGEVEDLDKYIDKRG